MKILLRYYVKHKNYPHRSLYNDHNLMKIKLHVAPSNRPILDLIMNLFHVGFYFLIGFAMKCAVASNNI